MALIRRFQLRRWQVMLSLCLSAMLCVVAIPTYAASTPQQDLQRQDAYIEQAIAKAEAKNFPAAGEAFKKFQDNWLDIEDGVKKTSRQAYKDIESSMGEVKYALSIQPPQQPQVVKSLQNLHAINQKFISGGINSTTAQTTPNQVTIKSLIERLDRADAAISNKNTATAALELKGFQTDWLEVEGVVAAKSKQAYIDTENNMAIAYGLVKSNDLVGAKSAIAQLRQDLQPYASSGLRYNLWDAALILLREGMEALLVVVALLAFLKKSDNADKSRWIWIGSGVGILASVVAAFILQAVFSKISAGSSRELIEGFVGLFAAAMLFYVSYWLHSKSSLGAWQGYIREQMTSALATNSVLSLAFLAFLAVFREGAETVLFYIGIAPSISTTDLVAGFGLGTVILIAIAAVMLGLGLKIPLKPFFLVTSVLIYYLGFKFIGSGIHSLQVAGVLPSHTGSFLPSWEPLGLFPTWETTIPQLAILLVAVAVVLYDRRRNSYNAAKVN